MTEIRQSGDTILTILTILPYHRRDQVVLAPYKVDSEASRLARTRNFPMPSDTSWLFSAMTWLS